MDTYAYSAYGLTICSALPIPELVPINSDESSADVVVRYGSLEAPDPGAFEKYFLTRTEETGIFYYLKEVGGLFVKDGREITIDPLPTPEAKHLFRHVVPGIGLGLLLHQRGVLTLHASAVSIDGEAVAFLGWKGMGKSTTASALHARGHSMITDDLLVLEMDGEEIMAIPGFPNVKLWPEAVAASFGEDPEHLPRIHPDFTKRSRNVADGFSEARLPLKRIYVLDYREDDADTEIKAMTLRDAYIEMVRHSTAARILDERGITPVHMRQCSELVRRVPIRRLARRHSLQDLAQLASRIEEDLVVNTEMEAALEACA